jgi:hypothetical protein
MAQTRLNMYVLPLSEYTLLAQARNPTATHSIARASSQVTCETHIYLITRLAVRFIERLHVSGDIHRELFKGR